MKKNVFIKVFFSSVIWTAACLGLAAYAASKAEQQDPEILQKVVNKVESTSSIHVSVGDARGREFLPAEDKWTFATPTEAIVLTTMNGDVEVVSVNAGSPLVITAKGRRHKSQTKLLETTATQKAVSLQQPGNDSTRDLKIRIQLPEDFKGKLSIKTVNGEMDMNGLVLNELDLQSVAGNVQIKNARLQHLRHSTVSGNVEIENNIRGNLELESISGDFELHLPKSEGTKFELSSRAGEIKNALAHDEAGDKIVKINSTSGDIKIK